ncbi:hypothetical protein SAMN05428988_5059 [Chitinophaga sp. YR573]|uniref:DUF2147 domain-containing protein n=1 Tax=Chitinophaga sp. YR573 TaxID=1881040 RepID=UPI0008AD050F|nr:DUF2147 domain-containing protein [Chitinophaga sp. YR573]SEW39344.1 hypothetical protein SAMN05428988_5059 [Chitinophaga sp. YR573]
MTPEANKVFGVWLNEDKDAKMEIFKSGNKYFGRLLWGSGIYEKDGKTPLKDTKNPDPKLRTRTRLNMVFMSDLSYDDGEYTGGKLYDARSGRTYSAKLKLKSVNTLEMRGYFGLSLLGQTVKWTRVTE